MCETKVVEMKESSNNTVTTKRYKVVSMFSGCGGMDLGFTGNFTSNKNHYERNPFDIIWANELNPNACRTYRRNLGIEIVEGDIWEKFELLPDSADIVIGGFPCQDISINNKNAKGVFGKRSGLYLAMVEAIKKLRPKIFIAENVRALLNKNNEKSLLKVLNDFSSLGYTVSYQLYNAADFGVPQTRERVFIVGTLDNEFYHPEPVLTKSSWVTAKDVLHDLENHPRDENWSHIWSLAAKGSHQGNRCLYENRPAYTMRAECHGNTHYHYKLDRRISMREGARIQSFPDDFIFESKLRETERQVGNAVPPVLAWHVAQSVSDYLSGQIIETKETQLKLAI